MTERCRHEPTIPRTGRSPPGWCAAAPRARQYGETAEALYLTQSFVYDTAEGADARFAGDDPGFIYSRYANPTVKMFEDRLALLEGAEACRAHGLGHGGGAPGADRACCAPATTWWRARRCSAPCRWILNNWAPRFGVETSFVDAPDTAAWRAAVRPNTKVVPDREPGQSAAGDHRHRRGGGDRPRGRRQGGGRQRLRHADLPEAAAAGRRHRGLFGHQAHRRPGPGAGRRGAGRARRCWRRPTATSSATPARRSRRSTPGCC